MKTKEEVIVFRRAFFETLSNVSVRINRDYRDRGGELLYKGHPRVDVILRDGTRLTAHFIPEEQPRDEDYLNLVAYGEEQGDPDRIVFLMCGDIARVEVHDPPAKQQPAQRQPFGFRGTEIPTESSG